MLQLQRCSGTISGSCQQRECHQSTIPALYLSFGRHRIDDVLDLFQGRTLLLPFCSGNTGFLVGQVEILRIGILNARLVARLQCQPLEKTLKLGKGRVQSRLA